MDKKSKEHRKVICPICGSRLTELYITLKTTSIFQCKNCTNAWTYPSPASLNYSKLDFHKTATKESTCELRTIDSLPKNWRKSILMQANLVTKNLKKGASILEIGCGEGIFLEKLKNEGYEVIGLEPSKSASKRAQLRNITVITGTFPSNKIKQNFDLIVLYHVLEHMKSPIQTLKKIKSLLKKDGKIFLIQTNYQALIPQVYKKSWYAWTPEQHYWHFTPKGIEYISKEIDMKPTAIERSNLCHPGIMQKVLELIPDSMDQFHIILSKK